MPAWLVLALLISLIVAVGYQLTTRHFGRRVVLYWALILAGFILAEALAETWGWDVTRFGDLRLAPDLAGAALVVG
ncbi:MAG: hypothetical protein ACRDFS_13155, partial [Chloroflexota bacterium]